ncbi:BTB/POZ and MATH domain-containing protein 2 [Setaria italica]|uniref:MATH domain-containing protein n=1 Tax=Setaria italica TaxID=4555 RepID=K3ZMB2_SETIT|nr:BTB/POZ and MATH domain-containing protein 2 [Setaria italica]
MSSSSPTLRALGGAWRRAREAVSFSSTRVRHKTGAHLHRIDNYSGTMSAALPGHHIESAPFVVGGHEWKLHFYPNGADESASASPGRASVKLVYRGYPWWRPALLHLLRPRDVTAAYEVSVLDSEGNRVLSRAFRPRRFSAWWHEDAENVATAKELRSAAMRGGKEDGGIVVRCDVTVMKLEKESSVRWYLRQLVSKF